MKTTKRIVALFLAVLMALSMVSVSMTAVAASKKKVTKITLNKTKVTLYTNEKLTLKAKVTPSNASNKKVKWSTSSSKIATVSSKGVVTPKKAGKVTITCAATDGSKKKATCAVTVKKFVKVTGIKLNATSKSVYVGKTYTLKATVSPSNATTKTVKWSSSNTKVATVSSKGVVKGVKAGTATITCAATDGSGKKATCKVTISNIKVSSVKLNKTSLALNTGKSATLTATVSPSNAENKTVKWTSSSTAVATVSSKGVVKGVKAGTATITCAATDGSGKKATCKVTVSDVKVTSVKLNKTSVTVYPTKSVTLTATVSPSSATNKAVKWTSSDTSVATVTSTGVVKGIKAGTATITCAATDGSGKKATCKVTVGVITKGISLTVSSSTGSDFDWYVGKTGKLTANITPTNTTNKKVTWTSSEPECVTVDSNGNVKVVKNTKTVKEKTLFGTRDKTVNVTKATITATAADGSGVSTTYDVNIKKFKPATNIVFKGTIPDAVFVGQTVSCAAASEPADASERGIKYTTSDKNVATVDENGTVTALKAGEVTITASSIYSPTLTVSKKITVNSTRMNFLIATKKDFYVENDMAIGYCLTEPGDAIKTIGWHVEIEDENVAAVVSASQSIAQIKFIGPGKTRIRAASENGKITSDWVDVEVRELRAANDYFENVKGGDRISLELYLFNGGRVAEGDKGSDIEYFLASDGKNFSDYFRVEDGEYGKYTVIVEKELPASGAYITFTASNGNIQKRIYFSPKTYELPSGTTAERLKKFKSYSTAASNVRYADCTKTVTYSDTVVDKDKSSTKMLVNTMDLTSFIEWFEKMGGDVSDSDSEDAMGLLDEMSPQKMVNDLFTGTQIETATVFGNEYPAPITVDAADVKDIEVKDNGATYDMKLILNDMTSAKAIDLISSSAYGKTMKVIDKAYMSGYADNLDLSGAQELGGADAKTSLTYDAINQKYSGGYVTFTINKLEDRVIESEYHYKSNVDVQNAKFNLSATMSLSDSDDFSIISLLGDLTLSIKLNAYFKMNVDSTTKYTSFYY